MKKEMLEATNDAEKTVKGASKILKKIYNDYEDEKIQDAIGVGIQSCKMQIPERPFAMELDGKITMLCPWCWLFCRQRTAVIKAFNFCPQCGQRIDWRFDDDGC